MKHLFLLFVLLCTASITAFSQNRARYEGTITRMRMSECIAAPHPLMDALSGNKGSVTGELCPEYVLVTESVVYVIVGKGSDHLVPLAETTFFHLQRNELLIRVDDAKHESRFRVKQMLLRREWERGQQIMEAAASAPFRQQVDGVVLVNARP